VVLVVLILALVHHWVLTEQERLSLAVKLQIFLVLAVVAVVVIIAFLQMQLGRHLAQMEALVVALGISREVVLDQVLVAVLLDKVMQVV
jgi:hypothetical protein